VLHVPSLKTNLLSIFHITHSGSGRKVEFTPNSAVITDISTGSQIAHGIADHGSHLYFFSHFVPKYISTVFLSQSNDIIRLWHEIFGYINYKYLHQLNKENMVEGLPAIKFTSDVCQGCILGKHLEKKFDKGKAHRASSPLGMIHSDIMGPFLQPSISKARYVLTFIDDFSLFTWVFFLKLKSEVFECLIEFKALAENESGCKIKILHTDNGSEYVNKYVQQLCIDAGIQLQHTMPYTPQQTSVAERKNRSLKEMANCMLQSKSLAPKLWDEAINYEAYI
jgi:transposase InsO family protein